MSIIKGMRRPNRSPSHPKMKAPSGRIIRVRVMAKVTCGMVRPKSWATGTKTKVRRKKSSASRVHPRKQAMKVLRCVRFSDLKSRTASTPSQLKVRSNEVETSLGEEPARAIDLNRSGRLGGSPLPTRPKSHFAAVTVTQRHDVTV